MINLIIVIYLSIKEHFNDSVYNVSDTKRANYNNGQNEDLLLY